MRHLTPLAISLLLLAGCGTTPAHDARPAVPSPSPSSPNSSPSSTLTPPAPARAPDTVGPATTRQLVGLVRIVATTGKDGRRESSTGMIRTAEGQVVTNNHAVAGALSVRATVVSTGREYAARVVATDPKRDVALLSLDGARGLRPVSFATRAAGVGQRAVAVGDAGGSSSAFTAATGSVLALRQRLVTPATENAPADHLSGVVLVSCDVVQGESGGPTYDAAGRVVGMTTASVQGRRGARYGVYIPTAALLSTVRALERR